MIALWCRTCNNQIKVDDDVTKVVCPYCSKAINVSELLGEEKEPVREMPADTGKNLKSEETPPPDTGKNYKNDGEAEVTSPPKKNIIKPIAIVLAIIAVLSVAALIFLKPGEETTTVQPPAEETTTAEETSTLLVPYYDEATEKYGYCTADGEKKIEPQFDYAGDFAENGLAWVKVDGKLGYINEKGEIVIEPQFDVAGDFAENGLAEVYVDDKCGYINE